ncbi:MAG: hypothetical protein IPK97_02610 [Ahniella sp.]|nr:hypothetical protein [Ahniella sp.]
MIRPVRHGVVGGGQCRAEAGDRFRSEDVVAGHACWREVRQMRRDRVGVVNRDTREPDGCRDVSEHVVRRITQIRIGDAGSAHAQHTSLASDSGIKRVDDHNGGRRGGRHREVCG